jgi:hypothetical protein
MRVYPWRGRLLCGLLATPSRSGAPTGWVCDACPVPGLPSRLKATVGEALGRLLRPRAARRPLGLKHCSPAYCALLLTSSPSSSGSCCPFADASKSCAASTPTLSHTAKPRTSHVKTLRTPSAGGADLDAAGRARSPGSRCALRPSKNAQRSRTCPPRRNKADVVRRSAGATSRCCYLVRTGRRGAAYPTLGVTPDLPGHPLV